MFKSHEEADQANRLYWKSLTPDERIAILIQINDDFYGTEHRLERIPSAARIIRAGSVADIQSSGSWLYCR